MKICKIGTTCKLSSYSHKSQRQIRRIVNCTTLITKREKFRKTANRCRTMGKITFRPHRRPGRCAISKWPGPVNALTFPMCQEKCSVPENQPQGQHWLSCGLRCKTREKKHINENTLNVKKNSETEKYQWNPSKFALRGIDQLRRSSKQIGIAWHYVEITNCAVQASKLE